MLGAAEVAAAPCLPPRPPLLPVWACEPALGAASGAAGAFDGPGGGGGGGGGVEGDGSGRCPAAGRAFRARISRSALSSAPALLSSSLPASSVPFAAAAASSPGSDCSATLASSIALCSKGSAPSSLPVVAAAPFAAADAFCFSFSALSAFFDRLGAFGAVPGLLGADDAELSSFGAAAAAAVAEAGLLAHPSACMSQITPHWLQGGAKSIIMNRRVRFGCLAKASALVFSPSRSSMVMYFACRSTRRQPCDTQLAADEARCACSILTNVQYCRHGKRDSSMSYKTAA